MSGLISYFSSLREHYERYFVVRGEVVRWHIGPTEKLHPEFFILELPPGRHAMWTYTTVGMSADRSDDNLIELIVYSARKDRALLELLTLAASYHRNGAPLGLHHTVNVGKGVSYTAACDHGLISLPYLDGEQLELFDFNGRTTHVYWFIAITEQERRFKEEKGCEALEQVFEEKQINYLDFNRESLV